MNPRPRLCDRIAPLAGFTVGVTADRRSSEQVELLRRAGARVLHAPAMHTHALGDEGPLRAATERIVADPPAIVMATTGIGVRSWFAGAQAWGLDGALLNALRQSRVHVRGPKALGAVVQAGLEVWRREHSERLDHMIDDLARVAREVTVLGMQHRAHGLNQQTEATPLRRAADGDAQALGRFGGDRSDARRDHARRERVADRCEHAGL